MPYRAPHLSGLMRDQLVVKATGEVEIDGRTAGYVSRLDFEASYRYRSGDPDCYQVRLDFVVVPEKHEPHAVYNLAGKIIGYLGPDGKFTPKEPE